MRLSQKIIKYLAASLAIFLTFTIISTIVSGIILIFNVFDNSTSNEEKEVLNILEVSKQLTELDIDVTSSNIIIKESDTFKIDTSNEYISYREDNDIIYITEKKHFMKDNSSTKLIVSIPKKNVFEKVNIKSGAGVVSIDNLTTKVLDLDLGAGKVTIQNLMVLDNTYIDGGAGLVTIKGGSLTNLDLNMGVGKFDMTTRLVGNNEIDHGVGALTMNLLGDSADYQIHVDKGIGNVTIMGNEIKDNSVYGNGISKIDIDGGMGSINIDFAYDN